MKRQTEFSARNRWTISLTFVAAAGMIAACGSSAEEDSSDVTSDVVDASTADGETDSSSDSGADASDATDTSQNDIESDSSDSVDEPDVAADARTDTAPDADTDADSDAIETDGSTLSPCEINPCANTDNPCLMNTCNPDTGLCELVPAEATDDILCDDEDPCTSGDVCESGVCAGTAVDCSGLDSTCGDGACNAETGECEAVNARNEGDPCDGAQDPCGVETVCVAGYCDSVTYACTPSWVAVEEPRVVEVGNIRPETETTIRSTSCAAGKVLIDAAFYEDSSGTGTFQARYACGTPIAARQSYAPVLAYRELDGGNSGNADRAGRTVIEPCEESGAIVGIAAILSDAGEYTRFQGLCSVGTFADDRPADWLLNFEPPEPPEADGLTDSVELYTCGEREVVIGFAFRNAGSDVVGINVECAPADVVLARGGAEPIVGEPNGDDMDVCPIGTVPAGVSNLFAADREFFMPTDARLRCAAIEPQTTPPMLATLFVEDNEQPGRGTATPTNPSRINTQCADDRFLTGMRVSEFVDSTTGEACLGGAEFECRGYDIEVDPVLLNLTGISLSSDAPELANLLRTVDRGAEWLRCPEGEYLVGIYSHSDELLNTVAPLCSRMQVSFFNGTR